MPSHSESSQLPDQQRPADKASSASAEAAAGQADQKPLETQPTVITKSPVLAQYPLAGLHPRDMGRLLEGESLGHFELLEYIGGGMGAVFKAIDTMLNRTVAVKVLSQEQSGDEEVLRRFQNEAQSAARLDHENISRVHYVGEDRGWHYIVFEFIEGANLRDQVNEQGPLPLAEAVSYTLQIADALVHASSRDVVHRDIKPSNVLITPDGRAKLVDMGLARLHHVETEGDDLTASGVTLGTFDYISPEQARDPRSADVRSDIYSLGCTLYFMLTGQPPFPEGTVLQKLLQHQGDEPPDPRQFRPELPDDLLRIMERMLAKSPEKRYATPAELVADLAAFAQRHGLPATATTSVVWLAPDQAPLKLWERHLPWAAPLALLVILVAVLDLVWSHEAGHAAPPPLRPIAVENEQPDQPESTKPPEQIKQPDQQTEPPSTPPLTTSLAPVTPAAVTAPPAAAAPGTSASTDTPAGAAGKKAPADAIPSGNLPPANASPANVLSPPGPVVPGSTGG
ncbi:MAG TPA: serine/threonine-protein kinase [Pirellulales bacterium]|nr:serine/threonine-protein kinase [Pirellulales bacterium]